MGWYRYVFQKYEVGARAATGFADVEVGGVGVDAEYHIAGPVGDVVVGVGGKVVEKFEHVDVGGLCERSLLLGELAEGYKDFVVD